MAIESQRERNALNQQRQRALYGAPLGERVHRLVAVLQISQARLAKALGMSPAMLSQLVSGRRVKIGDPTVLARLLELDRRIDELRRPVPDSTVEALLDEVAAMRWSGAGDPADAGTARAAADALRRLTDPGRLAAAADALSPAFPELADVLREAAR
ncbi:helix-turn-helix domain-containing protein [Pseudonocardia sp. CA-107938]|uniref:helix-turn-helix domain-containing protein n=1 Tax=Pseudonocardia sp. CA-107938 TaxID=3240021 RepID=UPI003D900128